MRQNASKTKGFKIRARRWLRYLIIILIIYCLGELASFLYTKAFVSYEPANVLSRRHAGIITEWLSDDSGYIKFSPELGWTIREYGKNQRWTANSIGIRGTREYEFTPSADKLRIMICGDGFAFCNDVKDHEVWPTLLEQMDPRWEVINFGVWGYALDQTYLRYLNEGIQYRSKFVLISFGSATPFRLVNTYRPMLFRHTGLPFTKPRFRVEDGVLTLVPNPIRNLDDYRALLNRPSETIRTITANDYYAKKRYKPHVLDMSPTVKLSRMALDRLQEQRNLTTQFEGEYTDNAEALDIMIRLADKFNESVAQTGAIPVFCIFPGRRDVDRYRAHGTKRYSAFLEHLDSMGYRYIDAVHAFDELDGNFDTAKLYETFNSVQGDEYIAKYIHGSLARIINEEQEEAQTRAGRRSRSIVGDAGVENTTN